MSVYVLSYNVKAYISMLTARIIMSLTGRESRLNTQATCRLSKVLVSCLTSGKLPTRS
jgi:hypothetical protein